jgi:hypothetical protein
LLGLVFEPAWRILQATRTGVRVACSFLENLSHITTKIIYYKERRDPTGALPARK